MTIDIELEMTLTELVVQTIGLGDEVGSPWGVVSLSEIATKHFRGFREEFRTKEMVVQTDQHLNAYLEQSITI